MNIQESPDITDISNMEDRLTKAGTAIREDANLHPPAAVLRSAIRVDHVTKQTTFRYSWRRIAVMVSAIAIVVVGGGAYAHLRTDQQQAVRTSTVTGTSVPSTNIQASDQSIDTDLSAIDSQMNGLSADNQQIDQSVQ